MRYQLVQEAVANQTAQAAKDHVCIDKKQTSPSTRASTGRFWCPSLSGFRAEFAQVRFRDIS